MLTFLPALILLLLHGPAHMEGRLARAGERADVGSRMPAAVPASARSNRAFLAELLRKFPGATVLAALADEPTVQSANGPQESPQRIPDQACAQILPPPATTQRDRDGPITA